MKTIKLWLAMIATLLCSLTVSAHDFSVEGIYYNIITSSTDLTVAVTYRGYYYDSYSNEYSGAVTIPSTVTYDGKTYSVTSIGDYAFYNCSSLTAITIPEGVTSIGYAAFENCSNLTAITIPEGVTSIGSYAFYRCSSLTSITLPESVTSIGTWAFCDCSSLTSITIPEGVTSIGNSAFYGCSNLTSIILPEGVTSIGDHAFYGCSNLTAITLPASVTSIGYYAFRGCSSLTSITIPEGVTSIGDSAFYGTAWYDNQPDGVIYAGKVLYKYKGTMPANTSVEVKEGTVSIGRSAFDGCSGLTAITLPASVTSIGYYAFRGCSSLTSITIPEGVTSIGDSAFYGTAWYDNQPDGVIYAGKVLYKYKGTMPANTSVEVKEGTVSIGDYAFDGCSGLTAITLPASVTSIGYDAFRGCSSLTSITIPEGVTSIGNSAFYGCSNLTSIILPEGVTSIGGGAFSGCSSLTAINIPEGVTSIGEVAFYGCSSLTTITIPEGVTSIRNYAFEDCSSLTTITIPEGVTSIGNSAFSGCLSLTSITIPESVTSIGSYAFDGCSSLKTVINYSDLDIQKGGNDYGYVAYYAEEVIKPTKVGDYGFATIDNVHYLLGYTGNETELILPDDYQGENYQIRKDAFRGCSSLTSIIIPEGVTSIGEEAFYGCENLKMVINYSDLTLQKGDSGNGYAGYYADRVFNVDEVIEDYAFKTKYGVHNLIGYIGDDTELTLPTDYQGDNYHIEDAAFYNCSSLTSITIPEGVTSIGNYAFDGCKSLTAITIPENSQLTSIGEGAFYGTAWYDNQPDGVIYIGKVLYKYKGTMPENTSIEVKEGIVSISPQAFEGCSSLTAITIPEGVTSIGSYAFYNCSSLTAVHISSIEAWCYIDFEDSYANPLYYAKNLYINGELVTELVIPNSVTAVKDYAFRSCTSLTTITLPKSLTSIGSYAFYGCENLKMVINYSDLTLQKGDSGNGYVAYYADKVVNVDCIVDGYCFKTRDGVHCLIDYLGDDTALVLPEDCQGDDYVIAESVFQGNVDIVSVKIPQTIGTIGNSAFADCANLASVEMARGVMSIGDKAFENCTSLASVTIPQNMRSIGHGAFKGCSSLASVEFKEGVETFGDNAFEGCAALTEIMLPKSLTAIGANAFKGCSGLTSVIVDKNVETFGTGAFEGCTVVKTLVVKGSVMPTVPSSALTLIVLYSPHPLAAEEFANKVYRDATLYVPTGSIARYQAADVWKNFWTIKEFDSTQEMSLSLDQTAATLTEDESLTLTASITPEFMADMTVTWSTSDAAVATVDEHGVVTALAAGTATITATTGGMQATCVVTVTKKEGEVVGIENSEIRNHESKIIYDLSGRRVEKMEKGIYIVGGKKVVIK